MPPSDRRVRLAACAAMFTMLLGCAQLKPYNEVRHQQGRAASAAWGKVDIDGIITTERANLGKLLATELATQDKLAVALRDHTLRSLVDAPTLQLGLIAPLDAMLQKLVGPDAGSHMAQAADHLMAVRQWQDMLLERQAFWPPVRWVGVPAPSCQALRTEPAVYQTALAPSAADTEDAKKAKRVAAGLLADIHEHCLRNPGLQAHPFAHMGGDMQAAWRQHGDLSQRLLAQQQEAASLAADYQAAWQAYQSSLGQDPASAVAATQQALHTLRKATRALEQANNALSAQFVAKQKLAALNDFVASTTTGLDAAPAPQEDSQAVLAFVLFPQLIDDAHAALKQARAPLALPLMIQRDQAQLALEVANREVASLEAQARLSLMVADTIYAQARQLWLAQRELDAAKAEGADPAKPALAAFNTGNASAKASMYRGAGLYLDAIQRLEARRHKLNHQLVAATDELRLAYAEVNAKQWASLINAGVEQVAAAGAAGIQAERVSALLNTAGVLYIGRGVNQ